MDAFSELVELYWVRLVALARSVTGVADAEDAVQDCLLRAWRKLGQLDAPEAFYSWMVRIVLRWCYRQAQRRRPTVSLAAVGDLADAAAVNPKETFDVERVLQVLAPRQRAVMHLTIVEGMSDREIGVVLRIDPASVRSHRRRARQRLQAVLAGSE